MNLYLKSLRLEFRKSTETIEFDRFNFFWGKIGAGKSSIARLIDYCFGAHVEWTYALQTEFVEAALSLEIGGEHLTIYRQKGAANVLATWTQKDEVHQVVLPARRPDEVVVPDTEVRVLSDLLFVLAGLPMPMVRKGRREGAQRMERLSFRDVYPFCYVDQDHIDSVFFRLEETADYYRRAKSVDTVRLLLGYHQDRVAAAEAELQEIHERRLAAKQAAQALEAFLKDAGFESAMEIDARVEELRAEAEAIRAEGERVRVEADIGVPEQHAVDSLREEAKHLTFEIRRYEQQLDAVILRLQETTALINELKMLTIRYSRTKSARAVLAAVDFQDCPRCNQRLPARAASCCTVCGQEESTETGTQEHMSEHVLHVDLKARLSELNETQEGLETQKARTASRLDETIRRKAAVDHNFNQRLREYDTAFISQAVEIERKATTLEQRVNSLLSFRQLPEKLDAYLEESDVLAREEKLLKEQLATLRAEAFKDTDNIERLESLFLNCLQRAKFPGITASHVVTIDRRTFWPEVTPHGGDDIAVTSFANMGSGGMKCIFKACFALALHRLAAGRQTALPTLLIIDSAMKNLSERENQEIFKSFFDMVYELAATELKDTQFIFIDKEYSPPPEAFSIALRSRHMAPNSVEFSPLIPYFQVTLPAQSASSNDSASKNSEDTGGT